MTEIFRTFNRWYGKIVLDHPVRVLICLMILIVILGYMAKNFRIDASADTLLLENDEDLRYARQVSERYGVHDFLLVAFTPLKGDLFDNENLDTLGRLRDELQAMDWVASVLTILDVPLLESPPISYADISNELPNLKSPTVDKALATIELHESPFYRDLLVSSDMGTTAIVVNIKSDPIYTDLIAERNGYLDQKAEGGLSLQDAQRLDVVIEKIRSHQIRMNEAQHRNIAQIRSILDRYRPEARIFLGGISMIADDMIGFIKRDLKVFGLGVFLLLVFMLGVIFKNVRWIIVPMLCCFLAVVCMMGVLGAFGWDVTVISSNFVSLQLIITLAIVVHLMVRYREFQITRPGADHRALVQETVRSKFVPCLYAALTTIAGFASLLLCDIKPVIHFGWMMSIGILFSLTLTFLLFPSCVVLLKQPNPPTPPKYLRFSLTDFLARLTVSHGTAILVVSVVLSVLTVMGIYRLKVENSFIDYFKKSTEIYQGMAVIDQQLGGTTPLDVILRFEAIDPDVDFAEEDEEFADPFDKLDEEEDPNKYWFIEDRMETIERVHDYLDGLPATGKVLSLATLLKIGRRLNDGQSLDSLEMSVLYSKMPDEYKDLILSPFINFKNNEVRFTLRIIDSMPSLNRNALLHKIDHDLVHQLEIEKGKARLAGMMVLYNNMLQSLFTSQIKTMGVVAMALLLMFLLLFRSVKLALIAFFPNFFSAGAVLGVMGWMNIPLDMMTITIAAISIGIAVDDTIHYIYRFREEIKSDGDYIKTLYRCHNSIGHAMYYTSVTIIIGFSILVFSNFWPTIYFGLFTSLAMLIALVAALTLLPHLLVIVKPFGVRNP
ncbi:efflux RND transporter permease subunit [Desulfosarcina ovata]|uniref:Membrane protein n=1 Tax=Desulfosarcina ovata subsp. ovata TaxID=2752305 RepID=A0A5K8A6I8_9BACT|nr:MMPL family transporter [Desulfosarcina ovata]BBO88232.1 membrane protein [Desulfosarcina ovata subsp. ovata]